MKLLIITNAYPSKEKPYAGVFVKNQAEYLQRSKGLFVDVFSLKRSFTGVTGSLIKYIWACFRFFKLLFKRYDVIHLHFFFPLIWLVVIYKVVHPKTRIVLTLHGSDIHGRFNGKLNKYLHKKALSCVSYIQAVGKELGDEFENIIDMKPNVIMSAGISQDTFYPRIKVKEYDFIFVGSFIERKGIDLLIEAIKKINDTSLRYCFVGSGPYEKDLMQLKKTYQVEVFKNLPQIGVAEKLSESKFFIFPTRYEPFGLVATEAIYCGVPIVVSDVGGMKEQLIKGKNGFLIDNLTIDCVVKAIVDANMINSDDYKELTVSTLATNSEYSLESVCDYLINHAYVENIDE